MLLLIIFGAIFAFFKYVYRKFKKPEDVPTLDETEWKTHVRTEDEEIKPFTINISDEILSDLKYRLENALPFQEPLEGVKQHYGMNTKLLQEIVEFWKTKYDWRERETFLNQFPQYTVKIQGLNIHYLHVKPHTAPGLEVRPLLLIHGWPGSVREFYELIPLLTSPQPGRDFLFEVIVPSIPGYGFSEGATKPGLGPVDVAVVFKNLMERLNIPKYYLQGGDWGSMITRSIATLFPEKVLGLHLNFYAAYNLSSSLKLMLASHFPSLLCTPEEIPKTYPLSAKFKFMLLESGYAHLHATKPDTVGVALRDSPVGLAAYILEKFTTWTNPQYKDLDDGGLTQKYTFTDLLDNVMIYWVTRSITTSMRLYAESMTAKHRGYGIDKLPVTVPSAVARFSYELGYVPKSIIKKKLKNLIQVNDYEGGHFAAFETPRVLAEDVYNFVEEVEFAKTDDKKDT